VPTDRPGNGELRLVGVRIDPVDEAEARRRIAAAVADRHRPAYRVATVNLDLLARASSLPEFTDVLLSSDLVTADGMPVLWLARLAGHPLPARVTGADLTSWLLSGGIPGIKIFLLGGTDPVIAEVRRRAEAGGVEIVGSDTSGPAVFDSAQRSQPIVNRVAEAAPDVLLVGLGAPRQEFWIARYLPDLQASVAIGVGGSLDLVSRRLVRAPTILQRAGLEWLVRLVQEPRRLWRRYLVVDGPFLVRAALRTLRERRQEWEESAP
jgi:N-acetylglucosaminyldiphosphoundecaprenol N-acetyl-beta-D-mannosaminyltransferase